MKKISAAIVLTLVVVLTGCAGDDEPKVTTDADVEDVTCVDEEIDDHGDTVPDLSTVVDCSKPHVYEVVGAFDLPKDALKGTSKKERIANRNDLAGVEGDETPEYAAYIEFAQDKCETRAREVLGFDDVTIQGVDAERARVLPSIDGIHAPWFSVTPEDRWLAGERQVICSARLTGPGSENSEEDPATKAVAAKDGKPLVSGVRSSSFPIGYRRCLTGGKNLELGPCDKPHYSELLFIFNASNVFDDKMLKKVDPKKVTDAQYKIFDKACTGALPQFLGDGYDRKKLKGNSEVGGLAEDDTLILECHVKAVDPFAFDLPAGSLMGTDAKDVKLVDVKR